MAGAGPGPRWGADGKFKVHWRAADERFFAKLRAMLGLDQCEFFGVGAAPMPIDGLDFFAAIGIEIVEMWGAMPGASGAELDERLDAAWFERWSRLTAE